MGKSYYNPELHHRHSTRLSGYNYASSGAYMVTICTFKKEPFFDLPASRAILEEIWLELPQRFKKLQLDEFVIMSDHVHFIVWLDAAIEKETTLGDIIGAYKSLTYNKWSKLVKGIDFPGYSKLWQRNYIERIIRNDFELTQKREYIRNNPLKDLLRQGE